MSRKQQYLVVVLAVFAVALGMRTLTLHWSPYPATTDGFGYAALARDTLATGSIPLDQFRADNFVFANGLAMLSAVVDVKPVKTAQLLVAVLGAGSCLTAVAIVRRLGAGLSLPGRQVRYAAVLAGLGLAVEGLYLRRTGVADEEAIGILLVPLLAIAVHRAVRTRRAAWLATTIVLTVTFPLVHTFSTLIAALTILGVLTTQILRVPTTRIATVGIALVGGFWGYFALYYDVAARFGLTVPYVGRVAAYPGLFVAWLIVLVVGILWLRSTSQRLQRTILIGAIGFGYTVLVANVFLPIFPGTVTTPLPILVLVLVFLVPAALASYGLPLAATDPRDGAVVVALLVAPIAEVFFALTASLTPEFFGTVMRAQTFVHLPLFVLASLTAAGGLHAYSQGRISKPSRRSLRVALGVVLVASAAVTAPLAFVDLDTLSYPSTTTPEEFDGTTFATNYVPGQWTTEHSLWKVGILYYPTRTQVSYTPVANWLNDGPQPRCPVLSAESWTTTGAHLFPSAPETISDARYHKWLNNHDLVYATTGRNPLSLTIPTNRASSGC